MKIFGTISELVRAKFRLSGGKEVTLEPKTPTESAVTVNFPAFAASVVQADLVTTADLGTITSAMIANDTITNDDIKSNAAIAYSKLNLAASIVDADISNSASISYSKLALSNNIVDGDISSSTTISGNKLQAANGTTNAGVVSTGVQSFGGVKTFLSNPVMSGLTASQAVVTDASKNLASLGYGSTNTASTLVQRDASGNFSAGTASLSGATVSGLTASQAVVTDVSKNLTSLSYTANATASTLVFRDSGNTTSFGTLNASSSTVTNLATISKAYIDGFGTDGDAFIEFEGQTPANVQAPTVGEARIFAGADGKVYVRKKGSSAAEELGAGGSGEVNLVDTPSDAGQWAGVNATVTTNTTAANNPLSGVIDSSISIASSTLNGYARTRFTMPSALKNRKLKLEWFQIAASLSSGAYKVEVWTNASSDYLGAWTELALSTDSAGTSSIPNLNGKYSTTFDTNGSDYYEIRLVRTAASAATLYVANVVCGPGIQPQGAVVETWTSYNPTGTWTTNTNYTGAYRRVGSSVELKTSVNLTGAPNNTELYVSIPTGLTPDASKFSTNNYEIVGYAELQIGNVGYAGQVVYVGGSSSQYLRIFYISNGTTSAQSGLSSTTPATWGNGSRVSITATLPIAEWAGSGTLNVAQNDVEYASNSTWDTDTGATTSFVYGPQGSQMGGALTGSRFKRVQFQTPIQAGDSIIVEGSTDRQVWHALNGSRIGSASTVPVIPSLNNAGNTQSGVYIQRVAGSTTQVDILFGTNASAASDDSPVNAWPSDAYWRVRKSSAGAAVGFGIVQPGTSAGLVSASGLPGNTTGNAIASGYVGEYLATTSSTKTPNVQDAWHDLTSNSVTLTPGQWEITGAVAFDNTGSSGDYFLCWGAYCTTAGNNTTTLPTLLSPTAGLNNTQISQLTAMSKQFITMPVIRHHVSSNTTIYLNAKSNQTNGSVCRVTAYLMARRIA